MSATNMSDAVFALAIATLIDEVHPELQKSPEKYPLAADLAAINRYLRFYVLTQPNNKKLLSEVTERLLGKGSSMPSDLTTEKLLKCSESFDLSDFSALEPVARTIIEPGQLAHISIYLTHLLNNYGYGEFPVAYMDELVQKLARIDQFIDQNTPISTADLWLKAVAQADGKLAKLEEAVVMMDKLRKNSSKADKLRELGNNLMLNKLYPQAIAVYTEAVEAALLVVSTENSSANIALQLLTNRAIAYIGLSCIVEAIDDLNRAIFVDRTFAAAWVQLGFCHLHMGRPVEAIDCYRLGVQCHSDDCHVKNGVSPLFVKRITELVSLCEKRAIQQRVGNLVIDEAVLKYKEVLACLHAEASPEDQPYYEYRRENEYSVVERANRDNASILTPTVLQDLHTNGFEATVVPMTIETSLISNRGTNAAARSNIREPSEVRREGAQDLVGSFDPALNPALAAASAAANSAASAVDPTSNQPRNNNRTTVTTLGPRTTTTTTNYSASYTIPGSNGNPVREILNNFGEIMERRNARANRQATGGGNGQGNTENDRQSGRGDEQFSRSQLEVPRHDLPAGARTLRETLPEVAGFLGNLLFSSTGDQSPERAPEASNSQSSRSGRQGDAPDVPDVDLD